MSLGEGLWNVRFSFVKGKFLIILWKEIPFFLSTVYNLISKYCIFSVFHSLGVGDISHLVYESRARFFNSPSML